MRSITHLGRWGLCCVTWTINSIMFLTLRTHTSYADVIFYKNVEEGLRAVPMETLHAPNLLSCARRCRERSHCKVKAFDAETQTCVISNSTELVTVSAYSLFGDHGWQWNTGSDTMQIYSRTDLVKDNSTTNDPGPCGYDWSLYSSSCYMVSTDQMNWTSSNEVCSSYNGSLATVTTLEEHSFIYDLANTTLGNSISLAKQFGMLIWLGANAINMNGTAVWVTGEPWAFTHWSPTKPSSSETTDTCLSMHPIRSNSNSSGMWNDYPCDIEQAFVCERPLHLLMSP